MDQEINTNNDHIPWIEKYRPMTIEDIMLDNMSMKKLEKIVKDKNMPNMIITGMPGIGKTTTIKCIARNLYGSKMNDLVLELNASDDRGIKIVQETIMNFCKKKIDDRFKHKIIILDEADNMTVKAQVLINTLMEKYNNTRFAFTCNTSEDIIESIQSRCIIMKYSTLTKEQITKRLQFICKKENVTCGKKPLEALAIISQGDARNAINNLQFACMSYGKNNITNETDIYTVCDKPQPTLIKEIIDSCIKKDFRLSIKKVIELKELGFSEQDITISMIQYLRYDESTIPELVKNMFLDKICMSTFIISKGLDTMIQLTACIAHMIACIK